MLKLFHSCVCCWEEGAGSGSLRLLDLLLHLHLLLEHCPQRCLSLPLQLLHLVLLCRLLVQSLLRCSQQLCCFHGFVSLSGRQGSATV